MQDKEVRAASEDEVPQCRLDTRWSASIERIALSVRDIYVAEGRARLFDQVLVNPESPPKEASVLAIYVVSDAARGAVDARGCSKRAPRDSDERDDLSVNGGCVVVAVDRKEVRCSSDAVSFLGDMHGRPDREHPALLYVLAHEIGHIYQRHRSNYSGRVATIELKRPLVEKIEVLKSSCDPRGTRKEEEADEMAIGVLLKLLPFPPYFEPALSQQGSLYWAVDLLNLAANRWQEYTVHRGDKEKIAVHSAFNVRFSASDTELETVAKSFVCDVVRGTEGEIAYPILAERHPPLEQRIRRVAEAIAPMADTLPTTDGRQLFPEFSKLQEQISPAFNMLYRETGIYLERLQQRICSRVNGDSPLAGCRD